MWFQKEDPPGWYPSLLRQWSFLFHRSMEEWSTSKDLTREKCSSSSFILRPHIITCPPSPSTLLVQLISQVLNFAILARQGIAGFLYLRVFLNREIWQVPSCNLLTVHNLSFFVHICNLFHCNWKISATFLLVNRTKNETNWKMCTRQVKIS